MDKVQLFASVSNYAFNKSRTNGVGGGLSSKVIHSRSKSVGATARAEASRWCKYLESKTKFLLVGGSSPN